MGVIAPYTSMTCSLSFSGTVMPPGNLKDMHPRMETLAIFSPWVVFVGWSKVNMTVSQSQPGYACLVPWEMSLDAR
jgi:hypothetical protein